MFPSPLLQAALIRFYTGRPAEAIPFWEEAIPLLQKISPLPSPTLGNLSLLGAANRETGRLAEAERTMRDGFAFLKRLLGDTGIPDPSIAAVYCELGLTLNAQARYTEAESFLRQSLENHDRANREKAREYRTRLWQQLRPKAEAESGLGQALAGQGKYAEAEPLLLHAFATMEAQRETLGGDRSKLLREAAGRLTAFYSAQVRPDQVEAWGAKLTALASH